ncbi:FAD-dependent monooxygenase [Alteromonas flava]|uniref:FAD-dependent monooxygenase n=1 Tax=Alteromonas flava TaxID=2048003 RepID=UPI000C28E7E7|nr:FAD-dependent monooxygenase [Alteromonas flava]
MAANSKQPNDVIAFDADVTIVGAGVVGLSLALALARCTSLSVALVEAKVMQAQHHPAFDSRCLALGASTYQYLAELIQGVSEHFGELHGCEIHHIQVSDQGFIGKCFLSATELKQSFLGVVAPLQAMGTSLFQALEKELARADSRLQFRCPCKITQVMTGSTHQHITLSDGKTLNTRLLVVADGGGSGIAQNLGYEENTEHYAQEAIIANLEVTSAHQNWAYERFTESGPLALLPLRLNQAGNAGGLYSLVWTVSQDSSEYKQHLMHDDEFFIRELTPLLGAHFGRCVRVSARESYPLCLRYTSEVTRHRSLVVGNAAQTLHPIAGQGFNLGLRDVMDLVALLQNTDVEDIGSFSNLNTYAQMRKDDRQLIMHSTDGLVRCFSNTFFPLTVGRNVGLLAMNKFSTLKQRFARRAMGYRFG